MKNFILSLLILTSLIINIVALPEKSYADSGYAMIVSDNAVFYSDASGKYPRFYLDKSYFVYVTAIVGDYARVYYMNEYDDTPALEGYVKTVDLSFFDKRIASPYPDVTVSATSDAVMFSDSDLSRPQAVVPVATKARYYGAYVVGGNKLYYVYCRGYVGYVQASAFETVDLPYHEEYLALIAAQENDSAFESATDSHTESSAKTSSAAPDATKIILIALLIVVGLTVLYFLIRPDKLTGKTKVFHDDE